MNLEIRLSGLEALARSAQRRHPAPPHRRLVVTTGLKEAVRATGLAKPGTCHAFRHSLATDLC